VDHRDQDVLLVHRELQLPAEVSQRRMREVGGSKRQGARRLGTHDLAVPARR
jgi:hypothetical protein